MGAQGARNIESGNEWATPPAIVAHAARILGIERFDLDPAASAANAKAPVWFDRQANGLEKDWFGHAWLNPPFSRSLPPCVEPCKRRGCEKRGRHITEAQHGAVDFADKAVRELKARRVDAIAWHGPVAPDTDWHAKLWPHVHERFEFGGRIQYNGSAQGGTFPSQTMILRPEVHDGPVPTHLVQLANLEIAKGPVEKAKGGQPDGCGEWPCCIGSSTSPHQVKGEP